MKCLLLLWCAAALQAGVAGGGSCAGPVVRGVHYTDEVLYSDSDIKTLDYDYTSKVLYFTTWNKLSKMDLYSKQLVRIEDWDRTSWGAALDQKTGDLYLGSDHGVYKYNKLTNKTGLFGAGGTDMFDLYFKDIVYFTKWPSRFVYTIVDGQVSLFEDLKNTQVHRLLIDNDDYIIYSNDTGLYGQQGGTKDVVRYEGTGSQFVWDLNMNKYGDVFVALEDGIYAVDKQEHQVNRILSVDYCRAVAFDLNNNIIYADFFSVHKLMMSEDQDCV